MSREDIKTFEDIMSKFHFEFGNDKHYKIYETYKELWILSGKYIKNKKRIEKVARHLYELLAEDGRYVQHK